MTQLVIDHLWQSTLFTGLIGLLTLAFRTNGAHIRFVLWLTASLKFLVPFSLIVGAGKILHWNNAPAHPAATPWLDDFIAPTHAVKTPGPGWHFETILWLAWACGVAVVLLCWTLQGLKLRAALKASSAIQIEAPIEVRSSPALFEPGLLGFFHPILMLPNGIVDHLTPKQLDLVLAHELSHWRRRDNLTAAIHMVVEALFWFHPLVWWIGRQLVAERERACDENVLAAAGDPWAYADSIVAVCHFYMKSPIACAAGVSGANLKDRVERIVRNPIADRLSRVKISALATLASATLLTPLAVGLLTSNAVAQPHSLFSTPTADMTEAALPLSAEERQNSEVRQLNITGNHVFSEGRLRNEMAAEETLPAPMPDPKISYEQDRLIHYQQQLRRFYMTQGYVDFHVTASAVERTPDKKDLIVTYAVEEGPRYKFGDVTIDSTIRDFDDKKLAENLVLKKGDWYNAKLVEDAVGSLSETAGRLSHAAVDVRPQFQRDRSTLTMGVNFHISGSNMTGSTRRPS
jgi:beta-lactamase regulating signal transducer with metallopeptidase domain